MILAMHRVKTLILLNLWLFYRGSKFGFSGKASLAVYPFLMSIASPYTNNVYIKHIFLVMFYQRAHNMDMLF